MVDNMRLAGDIACGRLNCALDPEPTPSRTPANSAGGERRRNAASLEPTLPTERNGVAPTTGFEFFPLTAGDPAVLVAETTGSGNIRLQHLLKPGSSGSRTPNWSASSVTTRPGCRWS